MNIILDMTLNNDIYLKCYRALFTFVSDVLVQHVAFSLDLAWAIGVAAGGAVILLVRELTANEE